ncbi:DUF4157 domain-containing protein [Myxococcus sp. CA040A]|uniref:eCIS core domain-containing protein n=1 Tax=Myxococcus sp. CA040A TaxID=2741738 RepID=UPI00157AE9E9|nr:DUF4157 domain-containing protein [Myxococcus sp. CA040A]
MDFARAKKPEVKPAPLDAKASRPKASATDPSVPLYLRGPLGSAVPASDAATPPQSSTSGAPDAGLPLYLRGAMGPGAVPPLQAKLAVAPAKSALEEQADQVARTASTPASSASASATPPRPPATPNRLTGTSGEPLSPRVRERVEPVVGRDLADVRVHQASDDRDAAQSIRARAFTHKEHVFLGRGESAEDVELLAHEMTHVVQQTQGDAPPVQRKPADYRQSEDGTGPAARMRARIDEELADEDVPDEQPDIDRGEVASKSHGLQPQARPDVDRAAQERPGVQAAATETAQVVDAPAQAEGEGEGGKGKKGEAGGGEAAAGDAEQSAAQDAFSMAAAEPQPLVPAPVAPVPQVAPVDAGGQALRPPENMETAITEIAEATQGMRDEGTGLQEVASNERANARILEGNLNLVRKGVAQSDLGVTTSQGHAAYRRTVMDQGRAALGVSRQKTAWVAEQAPQHLGKADAGREDSAGMAEESSSLSAESAANTPDDAEAAEKASEQRGEINQAGGDVNNMDRAFSGGQERARGLSADAAQAANLNTQAEAKLTESTSVLQRTDEKLSQMREQTDGARAQVEALADRPGEMAAQADETEAEGRSVVEQSFTVEERLREEQETHRQNTAAIPEETPEERALREEEGIEAPRLEPQPPAQPEPAQPEEGAAPPVADGGKAAAGARDGAPAEAKPEGEAQAAMQQAQATAAEGGELQPIAPRPPSEAGAETVVQRQPQAGYEDRWSFDPAGPIASHIPKVLGGTAPSEGEPRVSREEFEALELKRRQDAVVEIQKMAGKPFEQTTAWERRRIALRMMGRNLWAKLSGIPWPGFLTLAVGLVNPVTPLLGVVSGFGMIASGAANVVNIQAWQRDPIGNLLKIAADIATGLTIILGSITALAAVIAALCTALILVTFGILGPALGPVVAFCASVMVTAGGWTIAVGKFALLFQFLCFLKNLYEAGVARNAEELQRSSDRMSSDVSAAGNVLLQMGMAKLAQVGGRGMQRGIIRAGGGARWGGGLTTRLGTAVRGAGRSVIRGGNFARMGAAVRRGLPQVPGAVGRGVRSIGGGIRNMPMQAVAAARALPGVIGSPLQSMSRAFGWGMSRGYLLGRGVAPGLAGVRAAGAEGALLARIEAGGLSASAAQRALRVWEREGLEMLLADGLSAAEINLLTQVSQDALRRLLSRYSARELVDTAAQVGPRGLEVLARLDDAVTRPQLVWAMQLSAAEAEALLRQLSVAARAAIMDISAAEARDVIAAVGIGRVNTALGLGATGPVRGSHLQALLQRAPVRMAEDLLDSAGGASGRLVRLARVAYGLEPAEVLLPGAPVTSGTIILDSNARVAIDNLLAGVHPTTGAPGIRFADLAISHRDAINGLRNARGLGPYIDPPDGATPTLADIVGPDADLRLSPLAGAEAVGGQTVTGRPSPSLPSLQGITPDRTHPRYRAALDELIAAQVGKGKGGVDRGIIVDALFADTTPGAVPLIISVDEDLAIPLARQFGVSPRTFSPLSSDGLKAQLVQRYPEGYFVIQVQGRSLKIVFGPPTGRPPVPPN